MPRAPFLRLLALPCFVGASACSSAASEGTSTSGGATTGGEVAVAGAGGSAAAGGSGSLGGSSAASGGASAAGGTSGAGAGTSGASGLAGASAGTGGGAPTSGCGATPTGAGAAFPPVTDYTARDGGFGPAATTRNTGDETLGVGEDGSANKVAIFRPAESKYGQGGVTHPLLVWGNGSTNTVDIWQGYLARIATYGFVVIAPEQTQVTAEHMNRAIDYVLALASQPASGDCGKIDTTKIGSTGYSRGGGGAISVGGNARVTTTFFFAASGNVRSLKGPWGVVGGDTDAIFDWEGISEAVTGSTQPAFGAVLAGVDHNRVAGNAKAQEAAIGWMRWRLMGDTAGRDLFVGASCKLCSDSAFSDVVKTTTFDSQ